MSTAYRIKVSHNGDLITPKDLARIRGTSLSMAYYSLKHHYTLINNTFYPN